MCVNFQALEMDIAWLVWILNDRDTTLGQIVTSQLSFKKLLAVASSIFRYRVADDLLVKRLGELLNSAGHVEDKRNTLIHSIWFVDDAGTTSRIKATVRQKHGFKIQNETDNAKRLNEFADEVLHVSGEFLRFYAELYGNKVISSKPGITA